MKEDPIQAAAELIQRLSDRSRPTKAQAAKPVTTHHLGQGVRLVINRAEHCTFILGSHAMPELRTQRSTKKQQ